MLWCSRTRNAWSRTGGSRVVAEGGDALPFPLKDERDGDPVDAVKRGDRKLDFFGVRDEWVEKGIPKGGEMNDGELSLKVVSLDGEWPPPNLGYFIC